MKIVSQIVSTSCSSVSVKYSEEANLRPLDIEMSLTFWFENIENDRDSVFVVFSNDTLIRISSIRFNQATLLL